MTLTCTIFENKEQNDTLPLSQQHFINLGSYYRQFYIFLLIFVLVFALFFYLFDTANDKLSSFYNYLILLKHTCSQ